MRVVVASLSLETNTQQYTVQQQRSDINRKASPVSYTHLDVYKRQQLNASEHLDGNQKF